MTPEARHASGGRALRIELYALILCVMSIPLFETPKNILLVLASLIFMARHLRAGTALDALLRPDARLGFIALAVAAWASSAFALHPGKAFHGGLDYLKMYLLFSVIATDFQDEGSTEVLALALIVSATIGSVWGIVEYPIFKGKAMELNSVGHFNHTSIYLAMSFLVASSYFQFVRQAPMKAFVALSGAIMILALVLTTSRGTYVAMAAAIACIFFIDRRSRRLMIFSTIAFVLIASPLFLKKMETPVLSPDAAVPVAPDGSAAMPAYNPAGKGFSTYSLGTRLEHWRLSWEIYKRHPLVGVGSKHYQYQNPEDYGLQITEVPTHPHNLFFSVASQNGTAGLLALFALFYLVFRSLWRSRGSTFMWAPALGAFCIVIANGVFNTTLHSEHGLLFALITATISGR